MDIEADSTGDIAMGAARIDHYFPRLETLLSMARDLAVACFSCA
ncbi:hypothetical protein [Sphingobium baderi]|nr:hypothetical protein [Sphingobium baderi]WRD78741.1 hypothetical protein QQ987_20360 [Sphingobium baderi]